MAKNKNGLTKNTYSVNTLITRSRRPATRPGLMRLPTTAHACANLASQRSRRASRYPSHGAYTHAGKKYGTWDGLVAPSQRLRLNGWCPTGRVVRRATRGGLAAKKNIIYKRGVSRGCVNPLSNPLPSACEADADDGKDASTDELRLQF